MGRSTSPNPFENACNAIDKVNWPSANPIDPASQSAPQNPGGWRFCPVYYTGKGRRATATGGRSTHGKHDEYFSLHGGTDQALTASTRGVSRQCSHSATG